MCILKVHIERTDRIKTNSWIPVSTSYRNVFPAGLITDYFSLFHSYLAENQISSLPVKEVKEFRILVGHSLHHKAL